MANDTTGGNRRVARTLNGKWNLGAPLSSSRGWVLGSPIPTDANGLADWMTASAPVPK